MVVSARRPFRKYLNIDYENNAQHCDITTSRCVDASDKGSQSSEDVPAWSSDESSITASECRFIDDELGDSTDIKNHFPKGYYFFLKEQQKEELQLASNETSVN
jgi:hypothetical protein